MTVIATYFSPFSINLNKAFIKSRFKCKVFEKPAPYCAKNSLPLQSDEIVEQCLALTQAMIECTNNETKTSLLYILEEKLLQLQKHYQ